MDPQHQPISEAKYREVDNLLRQLGTLISIVRQHIRNYLDDIFQLIRDVWKAESPLQPTLIRDAVQ